MKTKIDNDKLIIIRRKFKAGISLKKIAQENNIPISTIRMLFQEYLSSPNEYIVPDIRTKLALMANTEYQLFKAIEENKPYRILLTAYATSVY